jgi:PadR family transcriptional regulator PadR
MSGKKTSSSEPLNRIELLQGTLDMIVLQTLAWGPRHGYGISQMIRANTHNVLQVETGSLYPALHRLEKKGWIASEWGVSDQNQRVKEYRLTAKGRNQLAEERSRWAQLTEAMGQLMVPPSESEA